MHLNVLHGISCNLAGLFGAFTRYIRAFYIIILAIWQVYRDLLHGTSGNSADALEHFACSLWQFGRGI